MAVMRPAVVTVLLLHSVTCQELISLDSACGVILQSSCPDLQKYVVGGVPSCAEKTPWNVLLERKEERRRRSSGRVRVHCGGSLISSRHVLTAAHCLWANKGSSSTCRAPWVTMSAAQCRATRCPSHCLRLAEDQVNVYLGVTNRAGDDIPEPLSVETIIIHPEWDRLSPLNNITAGHDLAVLVLSEPVTFGPRVWPVCLPSPADSPLISENMKLSTAGFGVREITDTERIYAEIINEASVTVANQESCTSSWKLIGDQICAKGSVAPAGPERLPDTCSGDSGGGLTAQRFDDNFVLVGVVSFGEAECGARDGRPGVYTNILSHVKWIRSVTESLESKCTTEDGRVCQLPFTFRGTQYTECTREHDQEGRLWCSTRTDHLGHHVQNGGHWGHCQDSCLSGQGQTLADNEISQKLENKKSWSTWTEWSACSKTCGGGKRLRSRMCLLSKEKCDGQNVESSVCSSSRCPRERSWSRWTSWSSCSVTCGRGRKSRRRSCTAASVSDSVILRDSALSPRGVDCPGSGEESVSCTASDCESARSRQRKWAVWGSWTDCSSSCLGGVRTRARTCEGDRGKCFGSSTDKDLCGLRECPLQASVSDGSQTTVILAGWTGDFIQNVTLLTSDGKSCPGPSLPIWLADHFSVFDGEKILTCGGRDGDGNTLCWEWDVSSGAAGWARAKEMEGGRSYADAVVSAEGQVWVTGGWDGKERHQSSEVGSGEGWRPASSLTSARYQHCGVVLADTSVVITGGQQGRGKYGAPLSLVERYNFAGPLIQTLPSLNQARWTHACAVLNTGEGEAVLVAGGRITSSRGDELSSVEMMVVGQPYWEYKQSLPQPRLAPSMVVIHNTPQLTGGNYEDVEGREKFPDTVLEYDVSRDVWRTVARIAGRSHHASVLVPSKAADIC